MSGKKLSIGLLGKIFKSAFQGFIDDNITKLSGALAYFTVFSMGPLLLILITLTSLIFGREAVEGRVFNQLQGFLGHDTALQLQQIIQHAFISGGNVPATIIGLIILLIGASSVFVEMQDSINTIWGLKVKAKKGWVAFLQNRFLSFSIIVGLSFLLLVSLALSAIVEGLGSHLKTIFPHSSIILLYIVNLVFSIGITGFIFAIIFKVLPDAEIKWKDVVAGAIATTILFLLGKFGISFYISKINIGTTYGAAGSLIVLLLWVYYSAIILYFGAEFTKAYAVQLGSPILPSQYAVTVKIVEQEKGKMSIQQKEKSGK